MPDWLMNKLREASYNDMIAATQAGTDASAVEIQPIDIQPAPVEVRQARFDDMQQCSSAFREIFSPKELKRLHFMRWLVSNRLLTEDIEPGIPSR